MKKISFRNLYLFLFIIVCLSASSGCGQVKKENPTNAPTPAIKNEPKGALRDKIEEIARAAKGEVGVFGDNLGKPENRFRSMQTGIFRCRAFINFPSRWRF